MNYRTLVLVGTIVLALVSALCANDWITAPSYYTHDPQTGERVRQYAPIGPFYTYTQSNYRKSGYRHTRSSLQAGRSSDHLHIVEEWGDPVRPYGEWRFPYRPYSVPYALWAPPYGDGFGFGYGGGYGGGYYGPWGSNHGGHAGRFRGNSWQGQSSFGPPDYEQPGPLQDGSYPAYRPPRRSDREFYRVPGERPHPPMHKPAPKPLPSGSGGGGS